MTVSKTLLKRMPLVQKAIDDAQAGYCIEYLSNDIVAELFSYLNLEMLNLVPTNIDWSIEKNKDLDTDVGLYGDDDYLEAKYLFDFQTPEIKPLELFFSIHTNQKRPLIIRSKYKKSAIGRLEAIELYLAEVTKQHLLAEETRRLVSEKNKALTTAELEAQRSRHSSVTLGTLNDTESVLLRVPDELKDFLLMYHHSLDEVVYHTTDKIIQEIKQFKEGK